VVGKKGKKEKRKKESKSSFFGFRHARNSCPSFFDSCPRFKVEHSGELKYYRPIIPVTNRFRNIE